MAGRDDLNGQPFTLGSADLGIIMADPYTEEDARILSTACCFASDDEEGPEEGMPLFDSVSDGIRTDCYWDQWFRAEENLDAPNLSMEFVPSDARLAQPTLEKTQVGVKTSDDYMPAAYQRWSNSQSCTQFMASDCLEDGEAMAADVPSPEMNGATYVGMDMSEDGAGASSISRSDSEKANMTQRARRRAANRKRKKERSRRQSKHRKLVHGSIYSNSDVPRPHKLLNCRHICCKQ